MKDNYSVWKRFFLYVFIGLTLLYFIYYLFDVVLNGIFLEWFVNKFVDVNTYTDSVTGQRTVQYAPQWNQIKTLFFTLLNITAVLIVTVVYTVSHFHAKKEVRRTITYTSHIINNYMNHNIDSTEVFPPVYAEIASQMVQLKSAKQQHEQALIDESNRKNDLITYLAHDLKTPLTSVIGYLSLLDEIPEMPMEQKAKYINITLDKAIRLEKLINEFFEITRYNLQQIVLEKETIDLSYMMVQMADEFYPILNEHGNTAELNIGENLSLYGDPIKLARVFNNILKNAISYSYPDTTIEIWTSLIKETTDKDMIAICFRNRGATIPKEKLNTIFEKFFRLDDARTTNTGGAGLGLAIASEIVTLHGGTITAESENEVTTFCVRLPLFKTIVYKT